MKYEIEIRSSKGLDLACNIYEKKKSLLGNNYSIMQQSQRHTTILGARLFIRFTRDLNDNMEVLGAKKILYSPSSSSSLPCIWSETVARQVKSLQARFFIISARKYSAHLTHPQPDSDNSRRSRKQACKELLMTKGF